MDFSSISTIGWLIIGLIVILLFILVKNGKKIKFPFFELGEDDVSKKVETSKNTVQDSIVHGHVGDVNIINNEPSLSSEQKKILELCIRVLEYAKSNNNSVSSSDLLKLCGSYDEAVYQMIYNEKVFYSIHGQRQVGIGKMKTNDINRLIVKYKIELSKSKIS